MKKGIALIFCLLFLAVPCSFAGDGFIFAPVISQPAPGEMDSYVISGDNGSEVIHVISLEPTTKDAYLVVGPDGESNVVIKFD
jgi:hypothetical protein